MKMNFSDSARRLWQALELEVVTPANEHLTEVQACQTLKILETEHSLGMPLPNIN